MLGGSRFIFSTVLEGSRGWTQTPSGNWVWPLATVAIKSSDMLPVSLVPVPEGLNDMILPPCPSQYPFSCITNSAA